MPGGLRSKYRGKTIASATSIDPGDCEQIYVTGSTTIQTITPPQNGDGDCRQYLVPTDGSLATGTSGNIAVAVTMPQNKVCVMIYRRSTAKWYPNISS